MAVSIVAWAVKNGIGPMPTSPKQKRMLIQQLPTDVRGKVYDLGSGWGTLAISLAKHLPQCEVIGYESSPIPCYFSQLLQLFLHYPNLKFIREDVFRSFISDASLVVCYLYPAAMNQLKNKFDHELKAGTIVITNTFTIPGWKAEKTTEANDIYRSKIYFYRR
jgi:Methyltransferase small domain